MPLVSIIIPTYCGTRYLGDAIESVLGQTYERFELFIVDDHSPDDTASLVHTFSDKRVKYIEHRENRGAVAARHTGVQSSKGQIIAFLDQDDMFHPDKLQVHVDYLLKRPEIGLTYNSRFEVDGASGAIRGIWQAPPKVSVADLVVGFPFSPSDTVLRRELAIRDDIWDQSYVRQDGEVIVNGGEIVFSGRLALAGFELANVERVLTYRRYHARRRYSRLATRCNAELLCQEMILSDPRCPQEAANRRNEAFATTYLTFAYYAFAQNDTALGHTFSRKAVELSPDLLNGLPSKFVGFLAHNAVNESALPFDGHFDNILAQLPPELSNLSSQREAALALGYLQKGSRIVMFTDGKRGAEQCFSRAFAGTAPVGYDAVAALAHEVLGFRDALGKPKADAAIASLSRHLNRFGLHIGRRLKGLYWVNAAFRDYSRRDYSGVPGSVARAIANRPLLLFNRGVAAIFWRSVRNRWVPQAA
jgi:glycosyltransferase involved in cell wall biosynthesis